MFRKLVLFLSLLIYCAPISAQDNRILAIDDARYVQIKRLQERGFLLELHPTALPYTYGEVLRAVHNADTLRMSPIERRWMSHIVDRRKVDVPENHIRMFAEGGGALRVPNSHRLDTVRPKGEGVEIFQRSYVIAAATRGRWVGQVGMYHDGFYDRDPDGLDSVLRAQMRPENGYLGFSDGPVSIYLGRFSNHWGTYGTTGTMISDNPRSYDQLNLRFGGTKYSFRSFFAELDAITGDGEFTGRAGADSVRSGLERRFLFAHRFDLRPNKNITLTIMESILISGPGTGFSLRFLNPFTAIGLENDNVPKNDENNALLGLMLWARGNRTTFHTQVTMDDLDVLNLGDERTSVAGMISYRRTFSKLPMDVGVNSTLVAARTYNTHQTEGQYVYLLRGLATQFNDFFHTSAEVNWYAEDVAEGLVITPRFHYLKQGEQTITGEFPTTPDEARTFLSGTVETTRRASLVVEYQASKYWWARIDAGVNDVLNTDHIVGETNTRFSGIASFGIRIPINGSDVVDL